MKKRVRKFGFTMLELLVVMVIIAALVVVAIPSARAIRTSFESTGAEAMISSAFSSARAMAAKEHRYAGIRFQKAYIHPDDEPDMEKRFSSPQYMIFIVHDYNATGLASGFRAVEGVKPIKLPEHIGVLALRYNKTDDIGGWTGWNNSWINVLQSAAYCDATTFSILFSPTGKLIIHNVRVINKDGERYASTASNDEIVNTRNNVIDNLVGKFFQDDYPYPTTFTVNTDTFSVGLEQELSCSSFIIFDKAKLKNIKNRWTDYLSNYLRNAQLPPPQPLPLMVHINQYTGTMIEAK